MKTKTNSSYIFSDSLDGMFVTDKHGKLFIFPWGKQRKGYLLENPSLKPKIRRFYWVSAAIFFSPVFILLAFSQNNFLPIILVFLACGSLWLMTWYLYSARITKSAKVSNLSYLEMTLEKVESDASDDEDSPS